MGPFDVFLVDPFPWSVHEGDIIVFRSTLENGPTVHRVVEVTPDGWATKGDANLDPDQLAGEPLVTRDNLLGRVVTGPDGSPILLRGAGITITEAHASYLRVAAKVGGEARLASLLFLAVGVTLGGAAFGKRAPRRGPVRHRRRAHRILRRVLPRGVLGRHVALGLLVLLCASTAWAAWQARSDAHVSVIVADDPVNADGARVTTPGARVERTLTVPGLGWLPTLVILDPATPHVDTHGAHQRLGPWASADVLVHEVGGERVGLQQDAVAVWRYPAVFPEPWTLAMHRALPGSPDLALGLLVLVPGAVWYARLRIDQRPVGAWLGLQEGWL
jgi:signal peptidase